MSEAAPPVLTGEAIDAPLVDEAGDEAGRVDVGREEVLVLDFGGQYSQLIARRLRECGVFAELLPHDVDIDRVRRRNPRALVLSGGPSSVYDADAPKLRVELLDLGIPVLGICYGMQAMALGLGGRVEGAEGGEFGRTELSLIGDGGRLMEGLPESQQCWMSHGDAVFSAPEGFTPVGSPGTELEFAL